MTSKSGGASRSGDVESDVSRSDAHISGPETESNHSSEIDELAELEMRTGLAKAKSSFKVPNLRKSSKEVGKKLTNKTLTFADSVTVRSEVQ